MKDATMNEKSITVTPTGAFYCPGCGIPMIRDGEAVYCLTERCGYEKQRYVVPKVTLVPAAEQKGT